MKFTQSPLPGAYVIELEKGQDSRGFFARSFCEREFQQHGLEHRYVQMNHSLSKQRGTLRGLHYQVAPAQEVKVVRCIRGRIWDCILDLRLDRSTYGQWFGTELSADQHNFLYVPKDFAHAFITLEDDCEVLYQVSEYYTPAAERGIRWNDPKFAIQWPIDPVVISDKDRSHPDYK